MLGLVRVGAPANQIVPGPRLFGGGPLPPVLPPGGGGGGGFGGGLPLGPLVPQIGRSGVGLALLGAYAIGFGIGTLLWHYLNQRARRLPPASGPGINWEYEPSGQFRRGAWNTWRVGPGVVETCANPPDCTDFSSTNYVRDFGILDTKGERVTVGLYNWIQGGNGTGYAQCLIYLRNGPNGDDLLAFPGGYGAKGAMTLRVVAIPGNGPGELVDLVPSGPEGEQDPNFLPPYWPTYPPVPVLPPPEADPEQKPAPPLLPPPIEVEPLPPLTTPETKPPGVPVAPPVTAPSPPITAPNPARPPITIRPDGTPEPEPLPPPTTRPPGVETIPGGEVGQPGTQPRPDLEGIAAEVGKIEQKVIKVLENQEKPGGVDGLQDILDLLKSLLEDPYPAGSYALFPACETDPSGEPRPPMVAEWAAGTGQYDLVNKKLDAVADLLQFHKELRQPVCNRAPFGEEVTVHFLEDRETAQGATLLRKVLRYRDRTGASVASHAAHWEGFEWDAGPAIVAAVGQWGTVQVWASSHSEGRRVVNHALSKGGWNPDTDPTAEWIETSAPTGRYGRSGHMLVSCDPRGLRVTKRRGPSGPPEQVWPSGDLE